MEFAKPDQPTAGELKQLISLLARMSEHQRFNKIEYFEPEEKQKQFLDLGALKLERGFLAGNRVGKSETGAFEIALHMTGDYPEWWEGRRFDHPVKGWVCGLTAQKNREVGQTKLCGQFGVTSAFGTGFIPKDRFADKPTLARGVTDAYDTIQVTHRTNSVEDGISVLSFKSYDQGREKFQGEGLDFVWCDEEPDEDVYSECLTRLEGQGIMLLTFTALNGPSKVYNRYMKETSIDRAYITMSLDECTHFTEAQKKKLLDGYPKHERKTRRYGIAMMGTGLVFTYDEEVFKEEAIFSLPAYWRLIWGIDFGISEGHPFAGALLAHDTEADCVHLIAVIKLPNMQPIHHAFAIKQIASRVPISWPQDGTQRVAGESSIGQHVHKIYKGFGLRMLPEHATWAEGGLSTEAAVQDLDQRITTNRFKVAKHLAGFFEEYRTYHRDKNGMLVKNNDDIISAVFKGLMMLRHARAVPIGNFEVGYKSPKPHNEAERPDFEGGCIGVDIDPF